MVRIQRLSRVMVVGCQAVAVLLPLTVALYWMAAPAALLADQAKVPVQWLASFGPLQRALGLAISFVPLGFLVWALWGARTCFAGFASGALFGSETTRGFRTFSTGLFACALLQPVATTALGVLMSWGAPDGQRQLVISLSSDTLLVLLLAGTLAVVGWVLAEASAIADENAQFV